MHVGTSIMPLSNTEPYALHRPALLLSLTQVIGGSFHFHLVCMNVVDYFYFLYCWSLCITLLYRNAPRNYRIVREELWVQLL